MTTKAQKSAINRAIGFWARAHRGCVPFDGRSTAEALGPKRNLSNFKPYRTARQKWEAKMTASKRGDGAFRCDVPRKFHPAKTKDSAS